MVRLGLGLVRVIFSYHTQSTTLLQENTKITHVVRVRLPLHYSYIRVTVGLLSITFFLTTLNLQHDFKITKNLTCNI